MTIIGVKCELNTGNWNDDNYCGWTERLFSDASVKEWKDKIGTFADDDCPRCKLQGKKSRIMIYAVDEDK